MVSSLDGIKSTLLRTEGDIFIYAKLSLKIIIGFFFLYLINFIWIKILIISFNIIPWRNFISLWNWLYHSSKCSNNIHFEWLARRFDLGLLIDSSRNGSIIFFRVEAILRVDESSRFDPPESTCESTLFDSSRIESIKNNIK